LENLLQNCRLCPRACGVDRTKGQTGFCGAGELISVARAALYHGEEPPLSGSRGAGAVFFTYCTLGCVYCQNRQISRRTATGKLLSVHELAQVFLQLQEQGAHNINLVTACQYVPQIIAALETAKAAGLHLPVIYNSGGYETPETLRLLEGYITIYLPDYKYYSAYYAERYSHAADYR